MSREEYLRELDRRWKEEKDEPNLAAILYQRANAVSGHGVCIALSHGTFWSKGWAACRWCNLPHGKADVEVELYPFRVVKDGVVRSGWSCTHTPPPALEPSK